MTRRDYIEMAKQIASMENRMAALSVAEGFAFVAKRDNPRFDAQKFYNACGLGVN